MLDTIENTLIEKRKFGDTREDGYRFHGYDKKKDSEIVVFTRDMGAS